MDHSNQIDYIARIAHEVNRAYCLSLGDSSQQPWESAPEWQRESARLGVALHLGNPDAGPETSHESWMDNKMAEGWQYGPVKDEYAKTHPCLMPFNCLPREQQAKDFLFRGVVQALAPKPAPAEAWPEDEEAHPMRGLAK